MRKRVDILGVNVDGITMDEAIKRIESFLAENRVHTIFTPNAEIMMESQRNPQLKDILNNSDLVTADGAGVVLASEILKRKLPEKVSGVDIVYQSFKYFENKNVSFYFFGAKPGIAEKAAKKIKEAYPGIKIAGYRHGYFKEEEVASIIYDINSSGADILLVALGAPKQENWINENKDMLNVKVCIGVGGTLDVLSGEARLAPDFFRRNRLEWLYRLCKEPRRAKRMLDLPRFVIRVIAARFAGK
jgi:N-acetylglucosaminyldiphosphoundecaprenol N-acetyl-beta-D-mannosaminyltransferase